MKPLRLESPLCALEVHPVGATVLSFVPHGQQDLLFVSPQAVFSEGRGIRGGIPVCWPWFAKHPTPGFPSHGVARTRAWTLEESRADDSGCFARWSLGADSSTAPWWPAFRFTVEIEATTELTVRLVHHNLAEEAVEVTGALHSYLAVPAVQDVVLTGLDGLRFHDKNTGEDGVHQGDGRLLGPWDRIFYDAGPVELHTPDRTLRIEGSGSDIVVWNPAGALGDLDAAASRRFVCIEAAQIQSVRVPGGGTHTLETTISPRESGGSADRYVGTRPR